MSQVTAGDPLATIGAQLVDAARRRKVRRRRQRRTLTLAALVLLVLTAGAAASGLGVFGTGVPAVDELLDIEAGSGPRDIRGVGGNASEPLPAPGLTGGPGGVALAYLSRAGTVCTASAEDIGDRGVRGGFGGCYRPADLARQLDRRGVVCCGLSAGPDSRVYEGHADADIVAVRVLVKGGPVSARLTKPWTPKAPGGRAERFFVAIDDRDIDVGGDGLQEEELDLIPHDLPSLELEYADGRVVRWDPPGFRRRAAASRPSRPGGRAAPDRPVR